MARPLRLPFKRPPDMGRQLVDLLGPTGDAARQSLSALAFNSSTSFAAGAVLGAIVGTLEELPGLLVMVPAAIGLRGNIFGALGNRISTTIHAGTFRFSFRRDAVLGQNVLASMSLTVLLSFALALIARVVAIGFGVEGPLGVVDLALMSILGGVLASFVVLAATLLLSVGAVRRGWDMDNLVAPTVSTLGDVLTIPALFLASRLVGRGSLTASLGWLMIALALVTLVLSLRSRLELFREILHESVPVLVVALVLSTLAGIAIERQLSIFSALPALLVLQPAFVSSAGALGGILASRMATGLHLGLVQPEVRPGLEARRDALMVLLLGFPVFAVNGIGAHLVALAIGAASPGVGWMVLASAIGGLFTVLFVIALAYYGTIGAWRMNVDPDTYGIPVVTASVDFVGVVALIVTVIVLGFV